MHCKSPPYGLARRNLVSAGGTKALCEPVQAVIKFKESSADSLSVYMLNQTGKRADSLIVSQTAKSAQFNMNKNTLWYEISNHKKKVITQGFNIEKSSGIINMRVHPNPGRNYSIVEFSFNENSEASFILYNIFGQVIMKEPVMIASNQTQQKRVDVSQLDDGIYFYGFQFNNGNRIIDKLVVSK